MNSTCQPFGPEHVYSWKSTRDEHHSQSEGWVSAPVVTYVGVYYKLLLPCVPTAAASKSTTQLLSKTRTILSAMVPKTEE
jgi:hypothetical protein